MIFFHKRGILKPWHSWIKNNVNLVVLLVVLGVHGASLGLSDDEAYYWVLAQKPALSYAFHPPAVGWLIAFFQKALSGLFGSHSPGLVRLPAALSTVCILALALDWLKMAGLDRSQRAKAFWVMLSFYGFFSLSWMMVPDIPLFLSWTLLFWATWVICWGKPSALTYGVFTLGAAGLLLSKYSGILAIISSSLCLWLWAPKSYRKKAWVGLGVGVGTALIPILIWNSSHQWGSLLYQIHDRHVGAEVSWIRYLRFWGVEALLAGPILVGMSIRMGGRLIFRWGSYGASPLAFVSMWVLPAAGVFCLQPLFSDFKLHWAFVVWWPCVLALAWASQMIKTPRLSFWVRGQVGYGLSMGAIVLLSCHVPVVSWWVKQPKLDITNDFYGWKELSRFLDQNLDAQSRGLPLIGSRYQTAAQLAFHLGEKNQATFLPRDLKERDEWPDLNVTDGWGPDWPRLKRPVLFVGDNRYDTGPEFKGAACRHLLRYEARRMSFLAKWFDIWRCDPTD